jgi:phospholipase/carboxylesterase
MKSPFIFKYTAPKTTDKKMPALFLFHGMGSNEENLLPLVKSFEETHHIFSLRGPMVINPGEYAYHTITAFDKPVRDEFDKALTSIQSFIYEAIEEYDLDPNDITLLGFSQGTLLAQSLALTMGNAINKVVALSGYIPSFVKEEEYSKRPVDHLNIFISHGVYDPIAPLQWGEESRDYFESLGANVTFKTYDSGHYVTPENHQDLIKFIKNN